MKDKIEAYLNGIGQNHLALGLDTLSLEKQKIFYEQLNSYGNGLLLEERGSFFAKGHFSSELIKPLTTWEEAGSLSDLKDGEELIASGKVACLILAGGMGSRLGGHVPKALIPLTLVKNKTPLQLFFEKTAAASTKARRQLSLAVMTSQANYEVILDYLKEHHFFKNERSQVDFFIQKEWPFLNDDGNWMLKEVGQVACGPGGNGEALKGLFESSIGTKWLDRGVEYVLVVFIDNPLADPFDAEFVGFHKRKGTDLVLKAVKRKDEEEKIGLIVQNYRGIKTVEYSEVSEECKKSRNEKGQFQFHLGNTGLFSLRLKWLDSVVNRPFFSLPCHWVKKNFPVILETSQGLTKKELAIWKMEMFFFDILDYTSSSQVLVYPRQRTFSPLKNAVGNDSLKIVQKDLFEADRQTYFKISGMLPKEKKFELDPQFYYPTAELIAKWKGRDLPDEDYIDAEI